MEEGLLGVVVWFLGFCYFVGFDEVLCDGLFDVYGVSGLERACIIHIYGVVTCCPIYCEWEFSFDGDCSMKVKVVLVCYCSVSCEVELSGFWIVAY